jgi:hypothetical protein
MAQHTDSKSALGGRPPCNVGFVVRGPGACSCEGDDSRVRADNQRFYAICTVC